MLWLRDQGMKIVGVELNEGAVKGFFEKNEIAFDVAPEGDYVVYRSDDIVIYCGDVLHLAAQQIADVTAVYDRAATVALPTDIREQYAARLAELLPAGAVMLLISMSYDESRMDGPPFSVPDTEVERLYQTHFDVRKMAEIAGPELVENLAERGLETLAETVYRLQRNSVGAH